MMSDAGHEIIVMIPMDGLIKEQVIRSCKDRRVAEELCRQEGVMCVTRDKTGRIYTHDGGIDQSNFPEGTAGYLPSDPDAVAMDIGQAIRKQTSLNVAVIIADTEIVLPGTMDISIGTWGISPQAKLFGQADGFGKAKFGGMNLVTYEIASTCALVPQTTDAQMRKTVKSIMRATALVKGLKERVLLKIASWFI